MCQTSEGIDAEILGEFVERNVASNGFVSYWLPRNAPELEAVKTKLQQIMDGWVSTNGIKHGFYVTRLT